MAKITKSRMFLKQGNSPGKRPNDLVPLVFKHLDLGPKHLVRPKLLPKSLAHRDPARSLEYRDVKLVQLPENNCRYFILVRPYIVSLIFVDP